MRSTLYQNGKRVGRAMWEIVVKLL
jgi:hypothetical protein